MRKIIAAIAVLIACLGLAFVGAQSASARDASATWGAIDAAVFHSSGDDYYGDSKDRVSTGGCVLVERKSAATNGYTSSGVSGLGKQACYGDYGNDLGIDWTIESNWFQDTIAIRLRELGTNRVLQLCSNQTSCQSMTLDS